MTGTTTLLLLAGCKREPRPSATARPSNNETIHKAVLAMAYAIGGLQGSVGEFATKNWRYVVPQVQADTKNVSVAFRDLKVALGYAVDF